MADLTDNMYPASTEYFGVPKEPIKRKNARHKEQAEAMSEMTYLKKTVEHFQQRIDFYNSVESIPVELRTSPEKFMREWGVNEGMIVNLEQEKKWLEDLIDNANQD